jgi:hypothetical protein
MISPQPSTPPERRKSNRAGLWAALTFFLLTAACLASVAVVMSGGRLPELGDTASWTPPPDQQEALAAPPAAAGGAGFTTGDAVRNASVGPVNLRQSPGFQNKPAGDVLAVVPAGQAGEISGGPQEADGLVWWRVRFAGAEGWMAERSSQGVTLLDRP